MNHAIVLTRDDRRQLGAVLKNTYADGVERHDCLRALQTVLEDAQEVEPTEVPQNVVTMNTTVELRDLDSGERETYTVVYPERADISANRISILAPIGTAVLGCRAGDVVEVRVPSGRRRIRIENTHHNHNRRVPCKSTSEQTVTSQAARRWLPTSVASWRVP